MAGRDISGSAQARLWHTLVLGEQIVAQLDAMPVRHSRRIQMRSACKYQLCMVWNTHRAIDRAQGVSSGRLRRIAKAARTSQKLRLQAQVRARIRSVSVYRQFRLEHHDGI